MKRLTGNAVVFVFIAYALASLYAAASAFWEPAGTLGLQTDYAATIRAVVPRGPADLAGIVPGDRVVLAATPFENRRYVAGIDATPPIGSVIHFRLSHAGTTREVGLTAVQNPLTPADRSALLFTCVASAIFVTVGAALILLRPTLATWGFGLYCLVVLPTADYPFQLPAAGAALAAILAYDVVQNIGVAGLLLFTLEFPRSFDTPWRARIRRWIPALFVALAAMTAYPDYANLVLGRGAEIENGFLQLAFGAVFTLAMYVLYDTYRRIAEDERERLRWVLIGFGLGLLTSYVGNTLIFSSLVAIQPPVWLSDVLISLNVLLPLTVAHAIVRHRVLDINFVVSRALVYAALTTVLAALFGLLDWGFGHVLEDFRLSRLLEAGISIGIAFAFDTFHKRAEDTIETIFFRKRRAAEARLQRLARELPQARSIEVVEKALIGEVVDAFELTSAALYRRIDDGAAFTRTESYGWSDAECASLDDTDLLVLSARARQEPIELADLPWQRSDVPADGLAPVVAVALRSRADLVGLVLYGGHARGGDVDPGELAQLEALAHAASLALDELEAERLRDETSRQTEMIAELNGRIDELRRLESRAPVPQP